MFQPFVPVFGPIGLPMSLSPAGRAADRVRQDPELQRTAQQFINLVCESLGCDAAAIDADDAIAVYEASLRARIERGKVHPLDGQIGELMDELLDAGWYPSDSTGIACRVVSPVALARLQHGATTPVAIPAPAPPPPPTKEKTMLRYEFFTPNQLAAARSSGAISEADYRVMRADWQSRGSPRVASSETVATPLPADAVLFRGQPYEALGIDEIGRLRQSGELDAATYASLRASWIERGQPLVKTATAA